MHDIFDFVIKLVEFLARTLSFLGELFSSIVFEYFIWGLGWFTCRLYTFGRYPQDGLADYEKADMATCFVVGVLGLIHLSFWVFVVSMFR